MYLTNIYLFKVETEALKKAVVNMFKDNNKDSVTEIVLVSQDDVVLVSSLLTLNIFHTFF